MLPFLAMAAGSTFGGWLSDAITKKHGKKIGRCRLASIAVACAALFVALGTQVDSARIASLCWPRAPARSISRKAPSGR